MRSREDLRPQAAQLEEYLALMDRQHAERMYPYRKRLAEVYEALHPPVVLMSEAEAQALGLL